MYTIWILCFMGVVSKAQNFNQNLGANRFQSNPFGTNSLGVNNLNNLGVNSLNSLGVNNLNNIGGGNPYAGNLAGANQLSNNFGGNPYGSNLGVNQYGNNFASNIGGNPLLNSLGVNSYGSNPYLQNQLSAYSGINTLLPPQDKESYCHAERCQACRDNFLDEPILTFDCAGKCSLCTLCLTTDRSITQCSRWCKSGIEECTRNCMEGKAICATCGASCGLKLEKLT